MLAGVTTLSLISPVFVAVEIFAEYAFRFAG